MGRLSPPELSLLATLKCCACIYALVCVAADRCIPFLLLCTPRTQIMPVFVWTRCFDEGEKVAFLELMITVAYGCGGANAGEASRVLNVRACVLVLMLVRYRTVRPLVLVEPIGRFTRSTGCRP